jgi:segregation and condensation protein B
MSNELNFLNTEEVERTDLPQATLDEEPADDPHAVKEIVEAVLFASPEPVPLAKLCEVARAQKEKIAEAIGELRAEYRGRAFGLDEIGDGYILRTQAEYRIYVQRLLHGKQHERLSQAAAEVLAIIAYRQPITRPAIEAIRGVDSSGTVVALVERGLVECVGKLEAPGRPGLYGTTTRFLQHFGLKDLSQLPALT